MSFRIFGATILTLSTLALSETLIAADHSKNNGFPLRSITETAETTWVSYPGTARIRPGIPSWKSNTKFPHAGKAIADFRAKGDALKFRIAAGELLLSRATAGQLINLHGKVVTRFGKTGTVAVGGVKSGAYILRTEGRSDRIFVP